MTYRLIAHQELASSQASITFSSIPQMFTDLYLVVSPRAEAGSGFAFDDLGLRLNGDTGSNYPNRILRTRDGAVGSFGSTSTSIAFYGSPAASATGNTFGNGHAYFPNYRLSQNKSVSAEGYSENNSSTGVQGGLVLGIWNNTAAITSIQVVSLNGWSFAAGSSATLYGITSGSSGGVTVS